ncbi:hypothetical protein BDZ97DRAFT_1831474 [Flammula alnicola]|nr:hypothetical protein BDZ97DRAFT_1831474 [Flammula alnicola]
MGLGMGAYGYTGLQAFACGASLSSTSLGTTLALLAPGPATTAKSDSGREKEKKTGNFTDMDLRRTRVGCVLVCAALLDDVLGLVVAGIITGLAQAESGGGANIQWPTIVRPILVSIAKAVRLHWRDVWRSRRGSLLDLAIPQPPSAHHYPMPTFSNHSTPAVLSPCYRPHLMAFVAGSGYAGTSELFGAYLAGALVGYIFGEEDVADGGEDKPSGEISGLTACQCDFTGMGNATVIQGKASHRVVWRGLVYALLMVLAKMAVGVWMLVWPEPKDTMRGRGLARKGVDGAKDANLGMESRINGEAERCSHLCPKHGWRSLGGVYGLHTEITIEAETANIRTRAGTMECTRQRNVATMEMKKLARGCSVQCPT